MMSESTDVHPRRSLIRYAFVPFFSKLLSVSPKLRITRDRIEATTSWFWQVLNLGTFRRQVVIDSRTKTIRITGRFFWFFKGTRTVGFAEVKGVTYGFKEDMAAASYVTGESEGTENYEVGLRLHSLEQVPLFNFAGEGEYVQHTSDIWDIPRGMIETALDTSGTQQEDSLDFVDLLCARMGVQLEL